MVTLKRGKQRWHPLLLLSLALCLIAAFIAEAAGLPGEVYCDNGVLIPSTDDGGVSARAGVCQCELGYLLPHCTYTSWEDVSLELWFFGKGLARSAAGWSPFSYRVSQLEDELAAYLNTTATASSPRPALFVKVTQLRYVINSSSTPLPASFDPTGSSSSNDNSNNSGGNGSVLMKAMVVVPGWAAQRAVSYYLAATRSALFPSVSASESQSATTTKSTWWCVDSGQFSLVMVSERHSHRPSAQRTEPFYYSTQWMRLYTSTTLYMSLEQCGWCLGALLLSLVVVCRERSRLFEATYAGGSNFASPYDRKD